MSPRLSALSVALVTLATSALMGCGGGFGGGDRAAAERASGPGAVSEGEARALDQAARLLDEQRLPEGAVAPPDPLEPADGSPISAPAQQDNPQ